MVANVDDPAVPRKVAETEPLGDLVRDVVVDDERAIVAVGAAGVVVVDTPQRHEAGYTAGRIQVVYVGQPGEPRLIEPDDTAPSPFSVVAVEGDLLLAAGG